MKKIALLLAIPALLASCGGGGSTQDTRPYTITIKPLGYKYDNGKYTITESTVELHSAAGAPDVRSIDYTAVMLNTAADAAGYDQSYIVPQRGSLFGGGKGGYVCTSTPQNSCVISSPDAVLTGTGPQTWSQNSVIKALLPVEWAAIHQSNVVGVLESPVQGDSAGWYAEFTFRAVQSNGKVVQWKQNYQIITPS